MIKFCSLYSGSSGNAIFLSTNKIKILIDAGLSGRRVEKALISIDENPSDLDAILVTHEHLDHIRGVGVLSRRYNIPIYANSSTWDGMISDIGNIGIENHKYFKTGEVFELGDFNVKSFPIPHDANDPVGFNFYCGGKKISIATDMGHVNTELIECIEDSDLLLIEANHDTEMLKVGPYPYWLKMRILGENGHLSNETASNIITQLAEKGTRRFLLGHLSRENNFPELAYQTVWNALDKKGISVGEDVSLGVVRRDQVGEVEIIE